MTVLCGPCNSAAGSSKPASDLAQAFPEMWGDRSSFGKALTIQRLGRILSTSYSINSSVRDTADKMAPRGYHLRTLEPVMRQMGIPTPSGTSGIPGDSGTSEDHRPTSSGGSAPLGRSGGSAPTPGRTCRICSGPLTDQSADTHATCSPIRKGTQK